MTINVTQLNNYIHGLLEVDGRLNDVSVVGEVTNLKRASNGWYFSLKDEQSAIDCFCYANFEPVAGMMVVAEGKINYWVKSGRISFFVRRLTSSQNTGAAYLKFLQLKEKLQKEGLFDQLRKKPVPKWCLKIGVVTSATGAVIHDIQNVVHRRQPFSDILLYPVKVQGVGADEDIAQGVRYFFNTDVDVVIVGRGGGSNEDLSPFNSEVVVRAVAECPKPIVSAVGHGVDFTLCDFAADRRAVTPTEAAEFVTTDSKEVKLAISARLVRLGKILCDQLSDGKTQTLYAVNRISSQVRQQVNTATHTVKSRLLAQESSIRMIVENRKNRIQNVTARLSAANPANVLQRGYAYLSKDGGKIYSVKQLQSGDSLTVKLADGQIQTTVNSIVEVKK